MFVCLAQGENAGGKERNKGKIRKGKNVEVNEGAKNRRKRYYRIRGGKEEV